MNKFLELLKIESRELATSFEKASIEGEGTPQEVSDRREEAVKKFLEKYFPFPFRIVKGNIIDTFGNRSNSIDCIVLNPSHPYTIDPGNEKASIIFADGVDYAIEVKPDFANKNEIERGLYQVQSVKKLVRKRHGLLGKHTPERTETAKRIPTFIFSDKTYVDLQTLISNIVDYYVEQSVPKQEQFDLIIINNRAIVFNMGPGMYLGKSASRSIGYVETGEDTLAMFLMWMNSIPKSEVEIGKNIIRLYLEDLPGKEMFVSEELNQKLTAIDEEIRE